MILLDTNVISELLRPIPDPQVEAWLADQDGATIWVTAVGEAELRYGVAILPEGRRRRAIARPIEEILEKDFRDRILPFDRAAAKTYAAIAAERRAAGRPIHQFDRKTPRKPLALAMGSSGAGWPSSLIRVYQS